MMEIIVVCECGKKQEKITSDQLSKKWPSCECGQFMKVKKDVIFYEASGDGVGDADGDPRPDRGQRILYRP